jgi:hypothetical protein
LSSTGGRQKLEEAALARDDELVLQQLRAMPIDFEGSANQKFSFAVQAGQLAVASMSCERQLVT